jgi:subtilase family serine protease
MGFWRLGVATTLLAAVFALASVSAATAAPTARIAKVSPAPSGTQLQLVLPLSADLAGLRRTALAITTPGSPQYGAYQPLSTLARRFGANAATRQRVLAFLRRAGARHAEIDPTGLFAAATLPAGDAARVFATPLAEFRANGSRFIAPAAEARASAASVQAARIPSGLKGLVTGVIGLDNRPLVAPGQLRRRAGSATAHIASHPTSARSRTGTPSGCPASLATGGFTPNQYLTAYGYNGLRGAGLSGQGQRVALIEVDGYKYSDLETFASCFHLPIPALNTFGVGISKLLKPGGEATLDLEVLDAAAPGLTSINVFETKASAADTLHALTAPLRTKQKPSVISASLGLCEPALSHFVGDNGVFSTEGALEMASASGVTFVASSGDQGSADCTSGDGTPLRLLSVNYPSSSWWVTGVGGTNLELSPTNAITNQLVWNDAAAQPGSSGGGGTSDLFNRPNYQRGSTKANGRAVPDVSMLADIAPGYAIFCSANDPNCLSDVNHNPWEALGGTSAATPLLAGGFAIVDQQLRAAHKRALGLVNPLLYSLSRSHAPGVFFDVTRFGNDVGPDFGNHKSLGCCSARAGFDEASGIGSVNLGALASAAVAKQPPIVSVRAAVPGHQHPVNDHALSVTVTCSGPCLTGAYALVSIGRAKPFEVNSAVVRLHGAGSRTLPLRFTSRELKKLRSALAQHTRISARVRGVLFDSAVYGVLFDAAGSITSRTGTIKLTISG